MAAIAALITALTGNDSDININIGNGGPRDTGPSSTAPSVSVTETTETTPTTTPTTASSQPVKATITPSADFVVHGGNLQFEGTVDNLEANSRTLWLVFLPEVGGGYYLEQTSPVSDADGPWTGSASGVGDLSDINRNYEFRLYAADSTCAQAFAAVRPNLDDALYMSLIIPECGLPIASTEVPVR